MHIINAPPELPQHFRSSRPRLRHDLLRTADPRKTITTSKAHPRPFTGSYNIAYPDSPRPHRRRPPPSNRRRVPRADDPRAERRGKAGLRVLRQLLRGERELRRVCAYPAPSPVGGGAGGEAFACRLLVSNSLNSSNAFALWQLGSVWVGLATAEGTSTSVPRPPSLPRRHPNVLRLQLPGSV